MLKISIFTYLKGECYCYCVVLLYISTHFLMFVLTTHTTRLDSTRHDTTRHDTTRHDTTRHDTTRHDTTRHDTTRHDTTRHDTTRHDTTRHDTTRHDTTRHDTTRHDTTRRDATRRDATRRDATRRDATRRDATRHDTERAMFRQPVGWIRFKSMKRTILKRPFNEPACLAHCRARKEQMVVFPVPLAPTSSTRVGVSNGFPFLSMIWSSGTGRLKEKWIKSQNTFH